MVAGFFVFERKSRFINMTKAHGGRRPGAGRKKGGTNKATAEVRELAQQYGETALTMLVTLMKDKKEAGAVRVSAAKEILDRAYGKATQPIAGDDDMPAINVSLNDFYASIADKA